LVRSASSPDTDTLSMRITPSRIFKTTSLVLTIHGNVRGDQQQTHSPAIYYRPGNEYPPVGDVVALSASTLLHATECRSHGACLVPDPTTILLHARKDTFRRLYELPKATRVHVRPGIEQLRVTKPSTWQRITLTRLSSEIFDTEWSKLFPLFSLVDCCFV
jgi:hypothetical protein